MWSAAMWIRHYIFPWLTTGDVLTAVNNLKHGGYALLTAVFGIWHAFKEFLGDILPGMDGTQLLPPHVLLAASAVLATFIWAICSLSLTSGSTWVTMWALLFVETLTRASKSLPVVPSLLTL